MQSLCIPFSKGGCAYGKCRQDGTGKGSNPFQGGTDPDDDSEGELSKRVRYLKREEGGVDIMCEVSERIMERGRKVGEAQGRKIGEERKARSTTLNLSRMGLTPEQIASAVGESLEQVKSWLAGAKPAN